MSGWRLIVAELYEKGPLTCQKFTMHGDIRGFLTTAGRMGLIERMPGGRISPYRLTIAGVRFAQNRLAMTTTKPETRSLYGRPRGSIGRLRPTWLDSLPWCNEIRLAPGLARA